MSDRRLPFISLPPSASLPAKCGLDLVSHLSLLHKGLQIMGRIPLIGCLGGRFCGQWTFYHLLSLTGRHSHHHFLYTFATDKAV